MTCPCLEKFLWDSADLKCEIQCLLYENTLGNATENNTCVCRSGYDWDNENLTCRVQCTTLNYTKGNATNNNTCECQEGFVWNNDIPECQIQCISFNFTEATRPTMCPVSARADTCGKLILLVVKSNAQPLTLQLVFLIKTIPATASLSLTGK